MDSQIIMTLYFQDQRDELVARLGQNMPCLFKVEEIEVAALEQGSTVVKLHV